MNIETKLVRELNAVFIIMLCLMISGAFFYQFAFHEDPCPLCLLQRLGMIAVMTGGMLNLKFGVRIKHYVLSILGALIGGSVSVRQILLHITPGSKPFDTTILGLALYTWAFIAFVVAILGCITMMYFFHLSQRQKPDHLTILDKVAFSYMGVIILSNFLYTSIHCGLGVCPG